MRLRDGAIVKCATAAAHLVSKPSSILSPQDSYFTSSGASFRGACYSRRTGTKPYCSRPVRATNVRLRLVGLVCCMACRRAKTVPRDALISLAV